MKKRILVVGIIFIILDQLLKLLVKNNIALGVENYIIPHFFYITNTLNTGGAFSIFENNTSMLAIIGLLAIIVIIYYFLRNKETTKLEDILYGILIGGIIGNLIDRLFNNGVIDYIGFIFGNYYYPVFNLADIGIVSGIIILMFLEFRGGKNGNRSN